MISQLCKRNLIFLVVLVFTTSVFAEDHDDKVPSIPQTSPCRLCATTPTTRTGATCRMALAAIAILGTSLLVVTQLHRLDPSLPAPTNPLSDITWESYINSLKKDRSVGLLKSMLNTTKKTSESLLQTITKEAEEHFGTPTKPVDRTKNPIPAD